MLSPGDPVGGTVSLASTTGDTGGSGIATVSYELAPNGGSFNSQPASWDTDASLRRPLRPARHRDRRRGQRKTSPVVTTRVDNTPPALNFTSPATGSVVSGIVSLVGSATDASPASPPITFAYKLHSDPPSAYAATGSSWNTVSLPAGDGLYDLRARATDDAANTTNVENTSIRVDNAPPTVAITAPAAAINGSLPSPTTFAANASDPSGSGVSQVEFFECTDQSNDCSSGVWSPLGTVPTPGPYSVSWAIPAADGNHALAAVATDNAGHTATAIRNVDVDRTAPNTSIAHEARGSVQRDSVVHIHLDRARLDVRVQHRRRRIRPVHEPAHRPGPHGQLAHLPGARDRHFAGNTDATPDSWTWHRDTNAPNAALNNPGNNVRQVVTLTSAENDPPANGYQSGIASVAFEYSANGTTWASIGTNTSAPFDNVLWNTALVADGVYQLRIIVSDAAGNSTTDVLGSTIRIDNTPPTTSQNDPGQYLRATKTLTGSASDAGSGIDHVDFERAPTGGGSWTTIATDSTPGDGFQASFDTTSVSDGHYDLRTVAYDVAGNQAAATPVTDRLVDNTPPDATISSPGAYLRGAVNLTSSTSDPGGSNGSGVVTVAYEYSTNGGSTWQSTGSNFNSSAVPDGNVDLRVVATDAAGNVTASAPVTSLSRQHEAEHHRQRTERLAVHPGHRHAEPERRRLRCQRHRVQRRRQPELHRRHERRHPGSGRRLERRVAHDRVLLGRQRRQHRDDQEHDRADRRDAADLRVLLRCRLPARNGRPQRRPRHNRLGDQVRHLRVHGCRWLDVDGDRDRHDRPRPVHRELGYDARARRTLRPAHPDHRQRGQRHDHRPA